MPWPTGGISTANLDAGTDSPALARPQLLQTVQAVNDIVSMRGAADGVASLGPDAMVPPAQGGIPPGAMIGFGGPVAPAGWLLCFGQAVSRSTYAALFAAIGTTWGAGDGSTTFNLPDSRGRTMAGKDDMGGTAANRLTTGGSGVNGASLGAVGGAETHTLTVPQIPAHTHAQTGNTGTTVSAGSFFTAGNYSTVSGQVTGSTGGGGAHNNVQPTLVANVIIKT